MNHTGLYTTARYRNFELREQRCRGREASPIGNKTIAGWSSIDYHVSLSFTVKTKRTLIAWCANGCRVVFPNNYNLFEAKARK
jgi:hypothetical protein